MSQRSGLGKKFAESGGIDSGEAGADAHVVYDPAHTQLVYVGSRATWTWDGTHWERHSQPSISAGTIAYDGVSGKVMLVQQDSSACDRTACHTTTWAWDSTAWAQVPVLRGPLLPLTRSGGDCAGVAREAAQVDDHIGVTTMDVVNDKGALRAESGAPAIITPTVSSRCRRA